MGLYCLYIEFNFSPILAPINNYLYPLYTYLLLAYQSALNSP